MTVRRKLISTHTAILIVGLTLCAVGSFLVFWMAGAVFLGEAINKVILNIASRFWPVIGLIVLAISSIGAVLMTGAVQKHLASQLAHLRKAASEIRDGNLGYELAAGRSGEFDELVTAFEEMRVRLKDSIAQMQSAENERRALMANICHDLKTPVTSIVGYAEGMLDGVADSPEKVEEYARTIYKKARVLSRLIADLNLLSTLEGAPPLTLETTDMRELLGEFCGDLAAGHDVENGSSLEVEYRCASELPCTVDRAMMERVFTNIAQNSIKHAKSTVPLKITVAANKTADGILISFSDNGQGIPSGDMPRVFDRFYRIDPSRGSGGSGLGLAITRQIVQLHKGKIWLLSPPGGGLTVNILIPGSV